MELGVTSCPNWVARLARLAGIRAGIGNTLDRQFDIAEPDTVWISDITYIKTYEGFVYLAVVIDLYSRKLIG
ncbi:hypothetical protein GCM10011498_10810 [Amylibacter cionae]|uniref:Integrase catalytic domain-containing protein n=1 Tax=Neptunicoccus cionae TaxID=2035344 RepID=A0A916QUH5_9RHOB|nr:hypothetical protein GCM10011498_10810 [Amylibacter cionae]